MKFHHVGYAVADIDRYLKDFLLPLFVPARVSPVYVDPIQRVRVLFAEVSPGILIELVEPLDAESPVTRFIGDARGGLYHLCYEVEDLDGAVKRFRKHRCLPLAPAAPPSRVMRRGSRSARLRRRDGGASGRSWCRRRTRSAPSA